ncbi:MAG: type II toxin-antitoxin system RelE/ParE family toxin [Opitutaceae bacterium]
MGRGSIPPRRLSVSWVYRVEESALHELRDLGPSVAAEIFAYLDTRISGSSDPRQFGKPLRGPLKGFWRYRVRDYRILCRLEDGIVTVVVVSVGHRSRVYGD